ncbi:MAG TPA: hypothetical protein VMQ46_08385 [Acidimicrobiia bacterium]|nr:hypothetical protein [Acidimicrobiia bacterium]
MHARHRLESSMTEGHDRAGGHHPLVLLHAEVPGGVNQMGGFAPDY